MEKIDKIKEKASGLAEKYGLDLLLLFGSQVSGKTHKRSDIDIAYFPKQKEFDLGDQSKLAVDLMSVFGRGDIDMVDLRSAPPLLMRKVADNCIVLYEREKSIFNNFYIRAVRAYFDSKVLFGVRSEYVSAKIKEYQNAR